MYLVVAGVSGLAQRLADVREMRAHSGLGGLGIVGGDGLNDGAVLFEGALRPPRHKNGAVLETHVLNLQDIEQARDRGVIGDLQQLLMQSRVDLRRAQQVAGLDAAALLDQDGAQGRDVFGAGVARRVPGCQTLQHGTRLQDLYRLRLGDEAHARATMVLALDGALLVEASQRGTHGNSPKAKGLHHVFLHQALSGQKSAGHDRLAQLSIALVLWTWHAGTLSICSMIPAARVPPARSKGRKRRPPLFQEKSRGRFRPSWPAQHLVHNLVNEIVNNFVDKSIPDKEAKVKGGMTDEFP